MFRYLVILISLVLGIMFSGCQRFDRSLEHQSTNIHSKSMVFPKEMRVLEAEDLYPIPTLVPAATKVDSNKLMLPPLNQ